MCVRKNENATKQDGPPWRGEAKEKQQVHRSAPNVLPTGPHSTIAGAHRPPVVGCVDRVASRMNGRGGVPIDDPRRSAALKADSDTQTVKKCRTSPAHHMSNLSSASVARHRSVVSTLWRAARTVESCRLVAVDAPRGPGAPSCIAPAYFLVYISYKASLGSRLW